MIWIIAAIGLVFFSDVVLAQPSPPNRARYYYGGEPHVGPASIGTMYNANGSVAGRSYTHSNGATTIYGPGGNVIGRASTDSQGTTTFYGPDGRKTGTAVPDGGR